MVNDEQILQLSFQEVLSVMTGQLAERVPVQPVECNVISMMVLQGQQAIILALATDKHTTKMLAAKTLGIDVQEVTEADGQDTLSEIVNQLAGMTKMRMAKTSALLLSPPFIIAGETIELLCKRKQNKIDQFYHIDKQGLKLSMVYL